MVISEDTIMRIIMRIHCKDINMKNSKTPFLTHARKLINQGIDPNTRVEFYDDEYDPRFILLNLGKAAALTIKEHPNTHFVGYEDVGSKIKGSRKLPGPPPGFDKTSEMG